MKKILTKITPGVEMSIKEEALDYLIYITEHYPVKYDLNIRTLVHSVNLRIGNEQMLRFGEKEEPAWKLLMKKYLIKNK